jgi:hypothetical protein
VYRVKIDGSMQTKLNTYNSDYLTVDDGWLYFANFSDSGKLYRMRTDGAGIPSPAPAAKPAPTPKPAAAPTVEELIAALKDSDEQKRSEAFDSLAAMGSKAESKLVAAMNHKDLNVRSSAIRLLEKLKNSKVLDLFDKHLKKYTSLTPSGTTQSIRGKVLVIDKDTGKIYSGIFWSLPENLRASAAEPENVKTAIWLDWGEYKACTYSNGLTAGYVKTCEVTVIDVPSSTVAAKKSFEGGDPPFTITYYGFPALKYYGSFSNNPIIAYIKDLKVSNTEAEALPKPTPTPKPTPAQEVSTGYASGYEIGMNNGSVYMKVDNSQNDKDVFVKVEYVGGASPVTVRAFNIKKGESFTAYSFPAGTYVMKYKVLDTGLVYKSEDIVLTNDLEGMIMTLYAFDNGNFNTYQIPGSEF